MVPPMCRTIPEPGPRSGGGPLALTVALLAAPAVAGSLLAVPTFAGGAAEGTAASAVSLEGSASGSEPVEATAQVRRDDPVDAAAARALKAAPARARVGRIRGALFRSSVRFPDPSVEPHELTFSMGFPARSRLTLSRSRWSVERFQLGDSWFGLDRSTEGLDAAPKSALLEGDDELSTRLDVAMRRALFLWPDEGALVGEGFTRTAKIQDVGVLVASLDRESGRPARMQVFGRDGKARAEFRRIEWREQEGRWWPAGFEFLAAGELVWTESVGSVETGWRFADTWFLPVDRTRGLIGQAGRAQLRMVPRVASWCRTYPMAKGADRSTWIGDGRRSLERARRELAGSGLELRPEAEVLLDEGGNGAAIRVRVWAGTTDTGPEGWDRVEPELTWRLPVGEGSPGEDLPGAGPLGAVRDAAARSGAPSGRTYVTMRGLLAGEEAPVAIDLVQGFEVDAAPPPRKDS